MLFGVLPLPALIQPTQNLVNRQRIGLQAEAEGTDRARWEPAVAAEGTTVRQLSFLGPPAHGLGRDPEQPTDLGGKEVLLRFTRHRNPSSRRPTDSDWGCSSGHTSALSFLPQDSNSLPVGFARHPRWVCG